MTAELLYPPGPSQVPDDLTKPKASYKRQVWLAMAGLTVFMLAYIVLMVCFGWITWKGALSLSEQGFNLFKLVLTPCAGILTLFMAKSLFAVKRAGQPRGMEVTEQEQPQLFRFIHTLADEIGAPRPHRVFLTPEVNAAVFYDLSLLNLLFPSKKNLIVGLGLVNVLSLGELKAVLAHEFGYFAQRSMMVGRWVYVAQQIIGHMVVTRDWLDKLVKIIGSIDLRIAWIGWLLGLVIWSIRAVVDTLFSLVIMAERALSREMEFNADLVAVSVTGSDALVNALHKLQAADHAWQTALNVAERESSKGKRIADLFTAQRVAVEAMRKVLDDEGYGETPARPDNADPQRHRVFDEQTARPPQMWATHPANRDREDNAKAHYVAAPIETRTAWALFDDPAGIRQSISASFYREDKRDEMDVVAAKDAVMQRFAHASLDPKFLGSYLSRAPMRNFESVQDMIASAPGGSGTLDSLSKLYPGSLRDLLKSERNLNIEIATLKGLQSGDLKPSGGVIRHRGEELKKAEIPGAIETVNDELKALITQLRQHDATCRTEYLQAAKNQGDDWYQYLLSLNHLLHATTHLTAVAQNEQALLTNTWLVITADNQVGYFEKRRMLRVAGQVQGVMRDVVQALQGFTLTASLIEAMGVENWQQQAPGFDLVDVTKKNWAQWCPAASEHIHRIAGLLNHMSDLLLEEMIQAEQQLQQALEGSESLAAAPAAGAVVESYPILMPGAEHGLQQKLDLWNRFQLAHGAVPTLMRLLVAGAIVGGTILLGFSY